MLGYVALLGKPNVGNSRLANQMIGQMISIVMDKQGIEFSAYALAHIIRMVGRQRCQDFLQLLVLESQTIKLYIGVLPGQKRLKTIGSEVPL